MAFNNVISRDDANALIPVEVSSEILQDVPKDSVVMQLARRLPNMTAKQRTQPVLASLPHAYFVNGDTGLKQTTEVLWGKKEIIAHELAVIVPIPEAVLDDSNYDIWGEIKPLMKQAFGAKFDRAVLFGVEAPSDWPDDLYAGALAAGQVTNLSAVTGATPSGDLYDALLGLGGVISSLEGSDYSPTGYLAARRMRGHLRSLRDKSGQPMFQASMRETGEYLLDGETVVFAENSSMAPFGAITPLLIAADWTKIAYALRQDLTYKVLDQAVITDASGAIIYNLAQQDMVALRCVMRIGWQTANPISAERDPNAAHPAAFLTQ